VAKLQGDAAELRDVDAAERQGDAAELRAYGPAVGAVSPGDLGLRSNT
jgi:hypothetical protein